MQHYTMKAVFSYFLLCSLPVMAQYAHVSTCLDGAGDRSSGGSYTNISAVAQPGGTAVSTSGDGTMVNYAGFLNTFSLQPGLDTDGDGLENEVDADNDSDGLFDIAEVEGSSFDPATGSNPNLADTDGDGITDYGEAVAGTNPDNSTSLLHIVSIADNAGDKEITYIAREGKTYRIRATEGTFPEGSAVLDTQTEGVAVPGDWGMRTNVYVDSSAPSSTLVYAIEPLP